MNKDYVRGLKFGLGFLTVLGLVFGIVFAVGFHGAEDVLGGIFEGNYTFNGEVNFNSSVEIVGDLNLSNNIIIKPSEGTCSSSNEGQLKYNATSTIISICNGVSWTQITSSYDFSCKTIYDSGNSVGDGFYTIRPDQNTNDTLSVYCDMTNDGGGWMLILATDNNNSGVDDTISNLPFISPSLTVEGRIQNSNFTATQVRFDAKRGAAATIVSIITNDSTWVRDIATLTPITKSYPTWSLGDIDTCGSTSTGSWGSEFYYTGNEIVLGHSTVAIVYMGTGDPFYTFCLSTYGSAAPTYSYPDSYARIWIK